MPQKKNPDLTELIRGKSGRLLGAATRSPRSSKACPSPTTKTCRKARSRSSTPPTPSPASSAFFPLHRSLKFNFDRMKTAANHRLPQRHGRRHLSLQQRRPFRKAHEIIGNAVRLGLETGRELNDLTLAELRTLSEAFAEDFFESITLEATLDCHDVIGGTGTARARERCLALEGPEEQRNNQ
jgi:argininosuccinate lyase